MKIALIGNGKTGSEVQKLLAPEEISAVFNTRNLPTSENLQNCDAIIVFVPGAALSDLMPTLMEAQKPVAIGSTGFQWPSEINQELKKKNISWVAASNFSISMNLVFHLARKISNAAESWPDARFRIHEIHHTQKKDMPSGTALTLQKAVGQQNQITAERIGDVKGHHSLIVETPFEKVTLSHDVLDRSVFARGALWTAQKLADRRLSPGLHFLEDVISQLSSGDSYERS